ncbi:L-threonylcarbamoyladenylate synthase [Geofilum sp. OHC36d9]|uniref:L-threonylcarbamoyladenylate synthase n=1 Tax=Geofilum sp. OHC36d9 TaxID=3458413 RepID=UPI0040346E37
MEKRYEAPDLKSAVTALKEGGKVLLPLDTGWCLATTPQSEEAAKDLFFLSKKTPGSNIVLLTDNVNRLTYYFEEIPDLAFDLMEMSEKPLTIILNKARRVPDLLIQEKQLAIRYYQDPFFSALCTRLRQPLLIITAGSNGQMANHTDEIDETIQSSAGYTALYSQDERLNSRAPGVLQLGPNGEITIIKE